MVMLKTKITVFLRRLEKYTKTDTVYVAKNGFEMFLGWTVSLGISVVLYLLYSRFLPQEVFGTYKYYLSLFTLFAMVTFTGIDTALVRSVANNKDGSLAVAFRRKLLGGFFGSLVFWVVAIWYFWQGNQPLAVGCILISLFAPCIYAGNIYSSFLTGKKMFAEYRRLSMVLSIATFLVISLGVVFVRDPVWLLAINLCANSVSLVGYWWAKRYVSSQEEDPHLISYGQHLSVVEIAGTFASQADSLLTFHFLGPIPLAVYSMANLPVDQLRGFLKISQSIAFPKFATQGRRDIRALIWKSVLLMGFTGVCCLLYALCIPMVFHVLVPRYENSIVYSQWLVFSLVFSLPTGLIATYFYAQAAKTEIVVYNLASSISGIALNIGGIWFFGLWGIVYATYAQRILMLLLVMWRVERYGQTKPGVSPV